MSYHADKLGDGRTDAGNDTTRRPKLASGKKKNRYSEKSFKTEGIQKQPKGSWYRILRLA